MIKAVIFDIGGVLVDNPLPQMIAHYAKHLDVSPEKFIEAFLHYEGDWQKGILSEKDFWDKMTTTLNVAKPRVESLWIEGFLPYETKKDEMFALIKKLKANGLKVVILSNIEVPIMNHFKKQSWPNFDLFVYSCEIGMRKPDRDIYEHTLSLLKMRPEEAVFIDDKPENITTAKEVGMQGIIFKNPRQVSTSLQKMGVSLY